MVLVRCSVAQPNSYCDSRPLHSVSQHGRGARRIRPSSSEGLGGFPLYASESCGLGGRLVVVLPALADDGSSGFENIMDQANAVLWEMVADDVVTSEERTRMVIGSYLRRKRDLLAPFSRDGDFQHLRVEDIKVFELPDIAWADFERDGNKEVLATKHALFFRSVFMPTLASALDRVRAGDAEALQIFGDGLEAGLRRRLVNQPRAMHSLAQTIVLAKGV